MPWAALPSLPLCCSAGLPGNAAFCSKLPQEEGSAAPGLHRSDVELWRVLGKDSLQAPAPAPAPAWRSPCPRCPVRGAGSSGPCPVLHPGAPALGPHAAAFPGLPPPALLQAPPLAPSRELLEPRASWALLRGSTAAVRALPRSGLCGQGRPGPRGRARPDPSPPPLSAAGKGQTPSGRAPAPGPALPAEPTGAPARGGPQVSR